MRKFLFLTAALLFTSSAFALDDIDEFDAAAKARSAHEKAASDMIYQNEEWKALYYQNQQIIQLLKEIRDTLDFIKTRDSSKPEEKS